MPPRKSVAPVNAVRTFSCEICDKGYPRQGDFENHLRSYDHNHRQRLADMKKLTAKNEEEAREKKRGGVGIPVEGANKKPLGPRFTKIGGDQVTTKFKKVGVTVAGSDKKANEKVNEKANEKASETNANQDETKKAEETDRLTALMKQKQEVQTEIAALQAETEKTAAQLARAEASSSTADPTKESGNNDTAGIPNIDGEEMDWEPYDFTKPTCCEDSATCPGCKTDGIWDHEHA